jgi:hypothetical protein
MNKKYFILLVAMLSTVYASEGGASLQDFNKKNRAEVKAFNVAYTNDLVKALYPDFIRFAGMYRAGRDRASETASKKYKLSIEHNKVRMQELKAAHPDLSAETLKLFGQKMNDLKRKIEDVSKKDIIKCAQEQTETNKKRNDHRREERELKKNKSDEDASDVLQNVMPPALVPIVVALPQRDTRISVQSLLN